MTHTEIDTAHAAAPHGSAGFAAIGAIVLTLIWGAYTATYLFEVLSMPFPTL